MAHPERWLARPVGVSALALLTSCTVFDGRSLPEDAGASDGSPGCGCANSGAIVCEDFEGTLGPLWTPFGSSPPTFDRSRAHCGSASLHLHTRALAMNETINTGVAEAQTFANPRLAAGFFVRAWVYVPGLSTVAAGNFLALLEAQQDGAQFLGIAAQIGPTAMAVTDWTDTPAGFAPAVAPLPRDTWTCVEWQVSYGASSGSSNLWMGGSAAPTALLTGANTQPSPPYAKFFVQIYFSGLMTPQPAFDAWIDDVAIDSQRIGCGK